MTTKKYRGIHFGNYKSQRTKFRGRIACSSLVICNNLLFFTHYQDVMDQVQATITLVLVPPTMLVFTYDGVFFLHFLPFHCTSVMVARMLGIALENFVTLLT